MVKEDQPWNWQGRYREVSTTSDYISSISTHNYELIDHFTLPDHFWWNEYYLPRRDRILTLREKYQGNLEAQIILDKEEHEIDLFKRYQDWYRSAFFVMQIMPKVAPAPNELGKSHGYLFKILPTSYR